MVGGWFRFNPFEKYARQNESIFPKDRGEHEKYLKAPPSISWFLIISKWPNVYSSTIHQKNPKQPPFFHHSNSNDHTSLILIRKLPLRELTYLTLGKGKHK